MPQIQLLAAGNSPVAQPSTDSLPHILLVVDGFPKALGGGERIVLRIAALLPSYGYRASILTLSLHPESEFRPESAPCPVYLLPLTNTYNSAALRAAFALCGFIRQQKVEVVQTFFESSDIWAGFVTRVFTRAKLVWSRRDMGILRTPKHSLAYKALRRFPHAVTAVPSRVAEHVRSVDHVPASKVHVVYNGLDLQKVVRASPVAAREKNLRVITTIGNIRHIKGHDLLVDAALKVIEEFPDTQFTVAGEVLEAEYARDLQSRIIALGLSSDFHLLGKISDLPGHLAKADFFVLPSRSEGFSNALIEAMAAGLPSIATDVGGNAEAIQNHQSGLIIPPEDAAALADAIKELLRDPEKAERLARGGERTVQENFTSDAMMRKLVQIFSALRT